MLDERLTRQIQDWLSSDRQRETVAEGAGLLLRLNRNRILHQNILRRPDKMLPKLIYELKKHLRIRLDGLTLDDVRRMDPVVRAEAKTIIAERQTPKYRGKRADHDSLPDDIKTLYEKNLKVFHNIRKLFTTLLTMEDAMPCDRYEYLKILDEQDKLYRANWKAYDSYQADGKDKEP